MAIPVYIEKRLLKERRRNGTRKVRDVLRWEDPITGRCCCESTATGDKTEAEASENEVGESQRAVARGRTRTGTRGPRADVG